MDYSKPLVSRPTPVRDGEIAFVIPREMQEKADEVALGLEFICRRKLSGATYSRLTSDFFDTMPRASGVMIGAFVPTGMLLPEVRFPGDIDLLVIPYADDHLLLSRTLAIELKAVRATYAKQGRSPNQYGFSQATALLECGFPYAAVVHLIVSDESPEDAWRDVFETTVLDEDGNCSDLRPVRKDLMPGDLIERCFGRLRANCPSAELGFAATYVGGTGIWYPLGQPAAENPAASSATMAAVGDFYERNTDKFLDTPRY